MLVYALFLLVFFAVPGAALFLLLRKDLLKYRRTILWCYIFVFTIGWFWDWLSFKTGVWRYDSAETAGIWIDGIPIEEFAGFYVLGTFLIISVFFLIRKKLHNV